MSVDVPDINNQILINREKHGAVFGQMRKKKLHRKMYLAFLNNSGRQNVEVIQTHTMEKLISI